MRGSLKKKGGYYGKMASHKGARAAKLAGARKGAKKAKAGLPFGGMKFGGAAGA